MPALIASKPASDASASNTATTSQQPRDETQDRPTLTAQEAEAEQRRLKEQLRHIEEERRALDEEQQQFDAKHNRADLELLRTLRRDADKEGEGPCLGEEEQKCLDAQLARVDIEQLQLTTKHLELATRKLNTQSRQLDICFEQQQSRQRLTQTSSSTRGEATSAVRQSSSAS